MGNVGESGESLRNLSSMTQGSILRNGTKKSPLFAGKPLPTNRKRIKNKQTITKPQILQIVVAPFKFDLNQFKRILKRNEL